MNKYKVTILPMEMEVFVDEGTSLLEAQIIAGLRPDAPCGGKGTCGKCLVEIISDGESRVDRACQNHVNRDMTIRVRTEKKTHHLLMDGVKQNIEVNSAVSSAWVQVERTKVGNHDTEWTRVKKVLSFSLPQWKNKFSVDITLLSDLYDRLKDNNYFIDAVLFKNEVIDFRNTKGDTYVMAFDIGTTSIVGYLLNADTSEQAAVVSMLNPQTQYGGDVIMRSTYAIENGVSYLTDVVRAGLNELINKAVEEAGIKSSDIYMLSIVGNTCMHHLLLGISPKALVHAPYNPVISEKLELCAKDLSLNINSRGRALILPNIAGFVGADTVGVLLATKFDKLDKLTLAIDIGTNGELVMGNKDRMVACSTAAGPAFEGAKIKCGMRGKEGAIDHFKFDGDKVQYSVIGDVVPVGICGSGLMDIVASLLEAGIVDESGKILSADELETTVAIANKNRLALIDGEKVFILYEGEAPVFISQKDIREVQLAKGAMAAGVELMAKKLGIEINDIEQVLIAGAFGNYMAPESACRIGLIPRILENRVVPIGNAAGEGAKMAAINYEEFTRSESIARKAEFLELATTPEFEDCFVDHLEF